MQENPMWKKLASLRPSLPRHIQFQPRTYNHERWYLLQDKSNGRFHRMSPSAYHILTLMDGRRSLQDIFNQLSSSPQYESSDDIPTQEEIIHLLQYLYVADLLICDMPASTQDLFARRQQKSKQRWLHLLINPLTWKITLGSPDKLLTRLLPLARLIASPKMGVLWLLVVGYALLQAGTHWSELTHGQLDRILSPANLLLLWLIYPLLKIVHELGHGLFTKVWGGQVYECGLVFVVGTPLPYVDASAATAFPAKRQRLMVSAAGIAVELFLAALALLLWLQLEAGLLRDILYNIMLIGGVSTLFFNGNPLMRFDGYHLLTDLLDTPNLASRANQQLGYWVQRYAYGMQGLFSPAATTKEALLLVGYSLAAFAYRLLILCTIILLVASYFPAVGVVIGVWLVSTQLLWPAVKYALFIYRGKSLAPVRKRALVVSGISTLVFALFFFVVPVPMSTMAEGVIWLPDDARIKTDSSGEVVSLLVNKGDPVTQGQAIVQLRNPSLLAELEIQQAKLQEFNARYQQAWADDRVAAQLLTEQINAIEAEISYLQQRVDNLVVRSPGNGNFRITLQHELVGSYLHQGDTLGIVDKTDKLRVRAALTQEEIGLVRTAIKRVEVRLASQPSQYHTADISQQVPAATHELPSAVLGTQGGGRIVIAANNAEGTRSAEKVFLVDLNVRDLTQQGCYGERVHIKFVHPAQSLAQQLSRMVQQAFIHSFS